MVQSTFLKSLDETLAAGIASLTGQFAHRQLAYVRSRQSLDGGFAGRRGGSDPYYTDFAVRALGLAGSSDAELTAAASYVKDLSHTPKDVVECFNRLNIRRILADHGIGCELDETIIPAVLENQRLASGGFARLGGDGVSAYNTFLGLLCLDMLGKDTSLPPEAAAAPAGLRHSDGGYSDVAGESFGQTNATAAAITSLVIIGAADQIDADGTARFLAGMQAPDGGLRAHRNAPGGDLLSTFTGLVTLSLLEALDNTDLPAVGRFVKAAAAPGGGFCAGPGDREPDVEYTYYGIAIVALLRWHVARQQNAKESS